MTEGRRGVIRIVHRYVRRFIVWCSKPSDEEAAQRARDAKLAHRKRLARNVRNALWSGQHYAEWRGLNREDAENLIEDVRAIAAEDAMIPQAAVDRLVEFLLPATYASAESSKT